MNIKKILTAAAAAAVLSVAGASAAAADSGYNQDGSRYNQENSRDNGDYRDNNRDNNRDNGWNHDRDRHSAWRHDHRRFADRDTIFRSLRYHRIHYVGEPYFVRGHYVVRSFDRFGRASFIEINPYTGGVIGVIRL